jgi:acyl-CoA thioester hydrolase
MLMMNGFCNFYQQLSYPGELILKTYIGNLGKSSVDLFTSMSLSTSQDVISAEGGATMVWVDLETNKSTPWPQYLLQKMV